MMNEATMSVLIAALSGGATAALVTALANQSLWRRQQRAEAAKALWAYHYALAAAAHSASEQTEEYHTESSLLHGNFGACVNALREAYPYAGYLRPRVRDRLFHSPWIHTGDPDHDVDDAYRYANALNELANELESELDWVFPRMFGERARVLLVRRAEAKATRLRTEQEQREAAEAAAVRAKLRASKVRKRAEKADKGQGHE